MYKACHGVFLCLIILAGCGGGSGGGNTESSRSSSSQSSSSQISSSSVSSSSEASSTSSSSSLSSDQSSSSSDISSSSSYSSSSMPMVDTPASVNFTAWIGEQDTIFELETSAIGMEFIGTTDNACDYLRYQDCDPFTHSWITDSKAQDTTLALGGDAHYALKNGAEFSEVILRTEGFMTRPGAEAFSFNNKLWIIGGRSNGFRNDIWSSVDGANWKNESEQAAFTGREYHRISYFNNQLWLIGGTGSSGPTNDIWSSTNGVTWILRNSNPAFGPRFDHALFVFNGKLWLIGGEDDQDRLSDIWSSSDGVNWNQETDSAAFGKRSSTQVVEFNNQLFLLGGSGADLRANDIWTSVDGTNWSLAKAFADFSDRYGHAIHKFDGKLWLTGGSTNDLSVKEIWTSDDGITWEESPSVLPENNFEHRVLSLKGQLYIVGGYLNDAVWRSDDSLHWENMTSRSAVPDACSFYEINGQLYASSRDVLWRESDAKNWTMLSQPISFPDQGICNPIAHEGKLYVVGGFAGPADFRKDVWSSEDGETWEQILTSPPFSARANQAMASFNGKMWMLGGNDLFTGFDEMWTSIDGIEWEQVDSLGLPTSGLNYKQFFVFNNKLWFIGNFGSIFAPERSFVAYSTADGITWQPETMNDLVVQDGFAVAIYDEKLWLFNKDRDYNAIFSSVDGNNWVQEYDKVPFWLSHLYVWNNQMHVVGQTLRPDGDILSQTQDLWMQDSEGEWRRLSSGEFIFRADE